MPKSTREEQIKELLKTPHLCGIRKLYRYRSMGSLELEGIFKGGKIYLPKPTDFIDPFECRPRLTLSLGRLGRDQYIKRSVDRIYPSAVKKTRERLIKEGKIILASNAEHIIKKVYDDFLDNTGLYCLSEVSDDILMWSHYADGHKGLCLEFDAIIDALANVMIFGTAIKVTYSEERPILNIVKIGEPAEYQKALLTKSNHWNYEKEWRVVNSPAEGGPGPKPFHPPSLTGVILGALISPENKHQVMELIKRYPTKLSLYQAKLNEIRFKVDIEPIQEI
ncbi:MAG: DUF2971 domain-containing protein [Desulfobaccales bacterium]